MGKLVPAFKILSEVDMLTSVKVHEKYEERQVKWKRNGFLVAVLATASAAIGMAAERPNDIRLDEIQLGEKGDGVCNVHTIDHVTAPDKGTALWFIEAAAKRIGRIDLATGQVQKFDMPKVTPVGYTTDSLESLPGNDSVHGPCDLLTTADGTLWFNYQAANAIGYMETKPPYRMKLLTIPTPRSLPMAMQLGADGNIYVELTAVDRIARISPVTKAIKEFPLKGTGHAVIGGTASKADGAHWFITMKTNKLIRFDYKTGAMEEFPIPTPHAAPFVVRRYDDGVWFSMYGANAIGHFDPASRQFTEIPLPTPNSAPVGIVMGQDGDLYSDLGGVDKIARIDRKGRTIVAEYPIPTKKTWPDEIKQGPDGAIWVPEYFSGKIARLWLSSFGEDQGFPMKE